MPRLVAAQRAQVLQIYRESHAVWGGGLSVEDYVELWDRIGETDWARDHARICAWVDEAGRLLSSLKVYRPRMRVLGRPTPCTVIGAIFTPVTERRRGHAAALVRAVLAASRRRGDALALLFSDIGRPYYAALGFRALPAEEHGAPLPKGSAGLEGWSLRERTDSDLPLLRQAWADSSVGRAIASERDAAHWELLDVRTETYFAKLRDPRLKASCSVGLHEGQGAGYLIAVGGHGEWHVREVATLGGDATAAAALLRLGAARARAEGLRRLYGWLPPEVVRELAPAWSVRVRPRRRAVPMICPLDPALDVSAFDTVERAYLSYLDQF